MKNFLLDYLENFWTLLSSIAPYILVGIFLAGAMKLLIRDEWIRRQMGGSSLRDSLKAILLGIPLPLCSCSVIPFATALRKAGASRPSTLSFLIATPITGVDSIAATYGVLGWFFTLYRIVSSIFIALLAATLSLLFDREESRGRSDSEAFTTASPSRTAPAPTAATPTGKLAFAAPSSAPAVNFAAAQSKDPCDGDSCGCAKAEPEEFSCEEGGCCSGGCASDTPTSSNWLQRLWTQSVETIFGDFAKALLLGISLGALLVTFMPESMSAYLGENLWLNYLLILAISAPLYICATSSIPLGVALLASGFSPGAVFVFLTAGPATSTVTMSVVKKVLGMRSLILYLVAVISGTLIFGFLFDTLFRPQAMEVRQMVNHPEAPGFWGQVSAVILLMLAWKVIFPKKSRGCCGG